MDAQLDLKDYPFDFWLFFIKKNSCRFAPVDLMVLARVCKTFRRAIKEVFPDYGIKKNMLAILTSHTFVKARCDKDKQQKIVTGKYNKDDFDELQKRFVANFYTRILKAGFFIFGSTLLCALIKEIDNTTLPFDVDDLDLFYPARRIGSSTKYITHALPELQKPLLKIFKKDNFIKDNESYLNLDTYLLYRSNVENLRKTDISVGVMENDDVFACAKKHISRSDLPLQRIMLSKNGFKMENLEAFLGDQIGKTQNIKIMGHLPGFMSNLRKVAKRNLRKVYLEISITDSLYMTDILQLLTREHNVEIKVHDAQTLRCSYPF